MAALELRARVPIKGESHLVGISICECVIQRIAEEVSSPLNRFGAQCAFSVHDPIVRELVAQHIKTGGLQRCVDAMGVPTAYLIKEY